MNPSTSHYSCSGPTPLWGLTNQILRLLRMGGYLPYFKPRQLRCAWRDSYAEHLLKPFAQSQWCLLRFQWGRPTATAKL